MESSPFRERRFAPADVRRIVRRAAEIAEHDAATGAVEKPLTQEEIERLAAELGMPASAVQRAISGDTETSAPAAAGENKRRILIEDEIEGELPASRQEDVIDAIHGVLGETGAAQIVGRTLTWSPPVVMRGQPRLLNVSVRARDGVTRVRIDENLSNQFWGLHLGLGLGMGLGGGIGFGLPLAIAMHMPALAFVFMLAWVAVSVGLARVIYGAIHQRRSRELSALRERLGKAVRDGVAAGAEPAKRKARIAAPASEADAEAEAQAEAEAEAEEAARARR